jgi:hypothetical protein
MFLNESGKELLLVIHLSETTLIKYRGCKISNKGTMNSIEKVISSFFKTKKYENKMFSSLQSKTNSQNPSSRPWYSLSHLNSPLTES